MPPPQNTAEKSSLSSLIDPVKFLILLAATAALLAVSCERIPPSVSIPGYDEKEAAVEKAESRPLGVSDNPPAFFPGKKTE